MISDCSKGRIFQLTNLTTAGNDVSLNHSKSGIYSPGNAISDWDPNNQSELFNPGAEVIKYQSYLYYLANNENGLPTLYRKMGAEAAIPLIEGVFGMQVRYGVDSDQDKQVDAYQTASTIADWDSVVSVKVDLLLCSSQQGLVTSPQHFSYNGGTFTASDTRWYSRSVVTVAVRNRIN